MKQIIGLAILAGILLVIVNVAVFKDVFVQNEEQVGNILFSYCVIVLDTIYIGTIAWMFIASDTKG